MQTSDENESISTMRASSLRVRCLEFQIASTVLSHTERTLAATGLSGRCRCCRCRVPASVFNLEHRAHRHRAAQSMYAHLCLSRLRLRDSTNAIWVSRPSGEPSFKTECPSRSATTPFHRCACVSAKANHFQSLCLTQSSHSFLNHWILLANQCIRSTSVSRLMVQPVC